MWAASHCLVPKCSLVASSFYCLNVLQPKLAHMETEPTKEINAAEQTLPSHLRGTGKLTLHQENEETRRFSLGLAKLR